MVLKSEEGVGEFQQTNKHTHTQTLHTNLTAEPHALNCCMKPSRSGVLCLFNVFWLLNSASVKTEQQVVV